MLRIPRYAGAFYPSEKEKLNQLLKGFFSDIKTKKIKGVVRALIAPHAGYIYSGIVAASCYKYLHGLNFDNVIIIGPSHYAAIDEPYSAGFDKWESPLGDVDVNLNLAKKLGLKFFDEAHTQEHSIEVQLPFLQSVLRDFLIVPVVLNYYSEEFTNILKKVVDGKTLIVVSSDLSHYLSYGEAVNVDRKTINHILDLDISFDYDACGSAGILTLIKIARDLKWKPVLADYKNSGDTAGDKAKVVGYAGILFTG